MRVRPLQGAHELAAVLKENKTLELLDMADNRISSGGATDLARALDVNQGIKSLMLSGNGIAGPGAQEIALVRPGNRARLHLLTRT